MNFKTDLPKRVTKKRPRVPADYDQMPWCFGKHSRRDETCLDDCVVGDSCFAFKEM